MEDRETARMRKYGESKTTRIMMATVPHVTSGLALRKFQADGFLLTRVYSRTGHRWQYNTAHAFCMLDNFFFLFRLLYFYPQSILDYQYMYVISTTIVYRDLTWGVVFQQTRSTLFYFCVKFMRICGSDQLVCSVWAVSVLVLLVWWVLVDLCVGVV